MAHKAGNGAILGIASEDGLPSEKRIVLMDRSNLSIVAKTQSDKDGAYAFTGLNPSTDDYLVFAIDDTDPYKKAIIHDRVQPISAHQGGFYWANWYLASMALEPVSHILGLTDGTDGVLTGGAGKNVVYTQGSSLYTNQQTITPSSASLPAIHANKVAISRNCLKQNAVFINQMINEASIEFTFSRSGSVGGFAVSLFTSYYDISLNNYNIRANVIVQVRYDGSKLTVYRQSESATVNNIYVSQYDDVVMATEYTISSDAEDILHVVATIKYSLTASLYVNGKNVSSASLLGGRAKTSNNIASNATSQYYNLNFTISSLNKLNTSSQNFIYNPAENLRISAMSAYNKMLSDDEVLALYSALFKDVPPQATGYTKAVVADYPSYFYRLHELDIDTVYKDRLRPNALGNGHELTRYGNVKYSAESIIKSGGGAVFNNGILVSSDLFAYPQSPNYLTITFVAKPSQKKPTDFEVILSHEDKTQNSSNMRNLEVFREKTAGNFYISAIKQGNITNKISFQYVPDTTAMHLYHFTIDKTQAIAKLYVDGVLAETVTVMTTAFALNNSTYYNSNITRDYFSIGGRLNNNLTGAVYPYYGYLAEVAYYPFCLTDEQIAEHYKAIDVL